MKVIQIAVIQESETQFPGIVALTDDGRIFITHRNTTVSSVDYGDSWSEVSIPSNLNTLPTTN